VSCRLFTGYAGFSGESNLWAELLHHGLDGQPVDELRDIEDGRGQPACWRNGRTFVFWSHVPRQPWQTRQWLSSLEGTLTPGEYARMVTCDFSASEESYVQEASWDACYDPDLPPLQPGDRTPLVIGLDASVSGDCSALVAVSRHPKRPDDVAIRLAHIWNPATLGGQVVQSDTIEPALLQLIQNYAVACCSYDEYQVAKLVQDFQRAGVSCWFHRFPQTELRMVADAKLRQLIIARRVAHDGNPLLREHVAVNAAARVTGDNKLRIVKKSRAAHVDGAVALSMAAHMALYLNL
jgi:phage terminase large subunit-like protein